jgi:hypothetical protein
MSGEAKRRSARKRRQPILRYDAQTPQVSFESLVNASPLCETGSAALTYKNGSFSKLVQRF